MKHTVEPNILYRNQSVRKFAVVDEPLLALKTLGHDVVIEDLDHDGWPEIYVGVDAESGNKWATSKGGNPLWTRPDGKTWKEVSKAWGVNHEANCVCIPAADFDNDGDLDLLLVNFYSQPVLLRNDTNDRNWLRVRCIGSKSSRDGIGAKVTIDGGGLKQFRQIHSGAGYCRCSPLEAHFGLGKAAKSYSLEVIFPSGRVSRVNNIEPGRLVTVKEE